MSVAMLFAETIADARSESETNANICGQNDTDWQLEPGTNYHKAW
jgi:hypothetical protein